MFEKGTTMHDELTDAKMFESLSASRQKELIDASCEQMMERIGKAESKFAAQSIVDEQCNAFDVKCASAVLRTAVRNHAQQLLNGRWGK